MGMPLVIECGNNSFAPYSFVCQHLIDVPTVNWNPIEVSDGREVEYDWLCDECLDKHEIGNDLAEVIVPICTYCVRNLKGDN